MKQMSKSTLFKLPIAQSVPLNDIVRYGLENMNTHVIQILSVSLLESGKILICWFSKYIRV